jgi:uncharacterized protein GlcG (DUF336 family)
MENSFRKAYTARTTRSPSGALVDRLKADPTLAFVHLSNIIAFQGHSRSLWAAMSSAPPVHLAHLVATKTKPV